MKVSKNYGGGYYTPLDIAVYISRWVLEDHPKTILEPSCGDGIFIQAIKEIAPTERLSITGFELFEEEAAKAKERVQDIPNLKSVIRVEDFLSWAIKHIAFNQASFDAVIGNPPFIRYQYLPEESQHKAETIFKLLQLPFTKHTNAWVSFVLASIALLKPGGRLGMVVPSEIIHVTHAQSLRSYLGMVCSRLLIVDPEEIWFEETLQGAVILLAEKKRESTEYSEGLGILRVRGKQFLLSDPSQPFDNATRMNGDTVKGKWTHALLTSRERTLLEDLCNRSSVFRFHEIAEVNVGIVTGANKFFLVDNQTVKVFGLESYAYPMFGRSEHCPGVIYDQRQHEENERQGNPTNFIWIKNGENELSASVLKYIRSGESQDLHRRYKCRIRNPWYSVPSVYATPIGMLKRAHDIPRLILNKLGAYTTDTAYRIQALNCQPDNLVFSFINPLTALSAELEGRHYGGGVLELIPSEIEKLLIPLDEKVIPELEKLDLSIRSHTALDVLEQQGRNVLGVIGVSRLEQEELIEGWLRLRNRRQRITD